jgi:hypothetical protein
MPNTEMGTIALGPGVRILDVEQNYELLAQLQEKPPLTPGELVQYASFFSAYQTNRLLADHLRFLAMADVIENQDVQEALAKADIPAQLNIDPEDFFDGSVDEGKNDRFPLLVKWVASSCGGLLVETSYIKGSEGSYIIAFCPAYEDLPLS